MDLLLNGDQIFPALLDAIRSAREPYDEPPRRIAAEVARLELDPRTIWLPKPGETLTW